MLLGQIGQCPVHRRCGGSDHKLTGRSTNEKVVTLGKLCTLLIDPETTASPDQLYKRLYTSFSVADLRSIAEECDAIARPLDDNYFDFWVKRYVYFRMFSRNWLRVSPGRQICLEAAAVLDFPPLQPDRLKSSFLESQNGCKPPKTGDSDAIGARIV
jgi:hypothetical protein